MRLATEPDQNLNRLETRLDSFDPAERKQALAALLGQVRSGQIALPPAGTDVNLHCHTFFSYNACGYSPTRIAWLARSAGWAVAGIMDFDVLDGLEEFLGAGRALGLKACVGMETRVYVSEFADLVINSPGEPGIAYHMGVGFPTARITGKWAKFVQRLRTTSENRNRGLTERVNRYLSPIPLDYDQDVLPLTPSGNATERHICLAYARKARRIFPHHQQLARFWADKLGEEAQALDLPEGVQLQSLIRSTTMKRGGIGYVRPDQGSFPELAETNRFILAAGGIPTHGWLDGTSQGEARIEELLGAAISAGAAAISIVPDRNYQPGKKDRRLKNLYQVVALAENLHLPVVVGTEMNTPGQKLVDDFGSQELAPLLPVFLKGAHIIYAHSVLQQGSGLGYLSEWAKKNFPDTAAKNEFFRAVGALIQPACEGLLADLPSQVTPEAILAKIEPGGGGVTDSVRHASIDPSPRPPLRS